MQSQEAIFARAAASYLLAWMAQHTESVVKYDQFLTQLFNLWITAVPPSNGNAREQIWTRFSRFVSSNDYISFWTALYNKSLVQGTPLLSFFLTFQYFTRQWKQTYSVNAVIENTELCHMSLDEMNGLWYVAGFVIRETIKKMICRQNVTANYEKSQAAIILHSFLEDGELVVDDMECEDDNDNGNRDKSTGWFDAINRGGLFKCTNDFYKFMSVLEMQVKCHLPLAGKMGQIGVVHQVTNDIIKKPVVTEEWKRLVKEEVTGSDLSQLEISILTEIVSKYFKVRVHGYTSKTTELYKLATHTHLQKSKSLRSKLSAAEYYCPFLFQYYLNITIDNCV